MAFSRTTISTTGNFTSGNTSVTNVANTTNMFIGMNIFGTRIQPDTQITNIVGTTVTMSKTATGSQTGGDITASFILQSGTDTDPSGLSAMAGVTTITRGSGNTLRTIFDLGTNQLRFQGTITLDPDIFEIVSNVRGGLSFEAGSNVTYGIARLVNGQTTYSKGTGLVSTFSGDYFQAFGITWSGGTFTWNGGVIKTFGAVAQGSNNTFISNTYDSVWQCWGTDGQFRSTGVPTFNAITFQGVNANCVAFMNSGWNALAIKYERAFYQTPAGGNSLRTIVNPVFTGNQSTSDIQANAGASSVVAIKNPDRFPNIIKMGTAIYADFPISETLSLNITNSTGAAAANVVGYIKDSNNGARINTATNTYVPDRTYIASSNGTGSITMGDILVAVFSNLNLTSNTVNYDYRSNFGNGSADFNIYLGGYEYNAAVTRQTLIGNNGKSVAWTMFNDTNITLNRTNALAKLASSFIVDPVTKKITVTSNATYDDVYDIAKAYKYQGTQSNVETPTISDLIITANGSNLTAYTGWSLIVNSGVTLSSGTKFEKITFNNITNNGTIAGVYADSTGTSTVLTVTGFDNGSSVYLEDNNEVQKYFNANASGDVVFYIPPTAVSPWYFAVEKYGNQRQSDFFTFSGGFRRLEVKAIPDVGITESNVSVVSAYSQLDTLDKIYDYIAYKRLTPPMINYGQIAFRDGTILFLDNLSLLVNKDNANVLDFDKNAKLITIKSIVLNNGDTYNLIKATPPATITANSTEQINVVIEDANGDSQLNILGGDDLGYELWKIPTTTATDDYATGVLLTTLPNNNSPYRFIGISGYDIVGRDISSGVRRRSSMEKGIYSQAFYVGNQIQLATDAPQLIENNQKLDELILIESNQKEPLTLPQFLALK